MSEDVGLDLPRHRDLHGRNYEPWIRRAFLVVFLVLPVAGLLNLFGQQPVTSHATGSGATLSVDAPETVRGGLIAQARFQIDADVAIEKPVLHLDEGWVEGLTLNTLEPSPVDEQWKDGGLELAFPPMQPGDVLRFYLQYQVNPINAGRRSQTTILLDGTSELTRVDRTITLYP